VQTDESLAAYYAERAPEFEAVYALPERQADLEQMRRLLRDLATGQDLLETACGTGYWTQVMAETARSITATDINQEVLALARAKQYPPGKVRCLLADAWHMEEVSGQFTAGAALFWWSHVPRGRQRAFLEQFHRALLPGALVVLADNLPIRGSSSPPTGVDAEGNSYQRRRLRTGHEFDVIKNYPSEAELRATLAGLGEQIQYRALTHFWALWYRSMGGVAAKDPPRPAPAGEASTPLP
jgi:demethylmenaquinone methyltransferase/2-methoxy-6-polyprenyl-1,4-benzoquinol methylase